MAATRKYAGLPDLDQAPDVYETPDLADDVSSIPATSARSPSVASEDGPRADEGTDSGVVRSKINADSAFTRFQNSRVDARKADFSERLNGSRQYYRTSNRANLSDDEEETFDQKLARLQREVDEVKAELAEREEDRELFSDEPAAEAKGENNNGFLENINRLSEALDTVYTSRHGTTYGASADLSQAITKFDRINAAGPQADEQSNKQLHITPSSPEKQAQLTQALAQASEFDARLTFLEQALGLTSDAFPSTDIDPPKPLLHTLSTLDRQLSNLTKSSATVDAASQQTGKLIEQAEHLVKTKKEYDALDHPTVDDMETVAKINALYGTLGTIDSLAPVLPMVLDRLRTLRLLHASAAGAGGTLDAMEKRLDEQQTEIKQWKEALEGVEKNVKNSEQVLVANVKSVEGWVKDLDERVRKLNT